MRRGPRRTGCLLGGVRLGAATDPATTMPSIMPKYCTYWLESMWSGAKYTAVTGMPSPVICSTHCGELDRLELELDADGRQVLLDLRHHRVEVDAVHVDRRVRGPSVRPVDPRPRRAAPRRRRRPVRAAAGPRCRRSRSGSATPAAGRCRRRSCRGSLRSRGPADRFAHRRVGERFAADGAGARRRRTRSCTSRRSRW